MTALPCLSTRKQHFFAGSLTCQHCGAPDTSHRSPTRTERAKAQGMIDRRRGKSISRVPYAAADLAAAWEAGYLIEHRRLTKGTK